MLTHRSFCDPGDLENSQEETGVELWTHKADIRGVGLGGEQHLGEGQ